MDEVKLCGKCKEEKPTDEFYKTNNGKNVDRVCKKCRLRMQAESKRRMRMKAARFDDVSTEKARDPRPEKKEPGNVLQETANLLLVELRKQAAQEIITMIRTSFKLKE